MNKIHKVLTSVTVCFWIIYTVATIVGADIVYNIFSPLTCIASIVLIASKLKETGKYKIPACFFIGGIFAWFVSDIILFIYTYIDKNNITLINLSDQLYLVPNYIFGMGLTAYMIVDFKKSDRIRLLIDTFIIGVAGFVLVRKLYIYGFGINTYEGTFSFSSIAYLLAVIYVIVLMILIVCIRGASNHSRAEYMIFISLGIYNIFEMRYTYYTAGGLDAESIYIDIIYMACVCVMAYSFTDPSLKLSMEYSSKYMKRKENIEKIMGPGWIFGLLLIPVIVFFFIVKVLTANEFTILIFSCLGYLVMWKTQQANELTLRLLDKQKDENIKLGEKVDLKDKALKEANEELENAVFKDALTGLYNRKYGKIYIENLLYTNNKKFALYSMDINQFKAINDNYGTDTGDDVLREIGNRLNILQSNEISVFRTGGDEFLVIYDNYETYDNLITFAEKLKETLNTPIKTWKLTLNISISIGISAYPHDGADPDMLIKCADTACSSIKHKHSNADFKFFDSNIDKHLSRKRKLEVLLQSVDYNKSFSLYYQPQIDCITEELIGMEELIRWNDPELGFISPAEFIPIAEEMGLMDNIGKWVNKTAMKQIKIWNEKYNKEYVMDINVSPLQLQKQDFADTFTEEQINQSIPSEWLDIEITEGYAFNSGLSEDKNITTLKHNNITFSVDDFGTGYSSFNSMLNLIFDRIKIAKELIDELVTNHNAYVVVKAIISMARELNLHTIAEGVETMEQLEILRDLGCEQIQGYYFGTPIPPELFEEKWLNK